MVSQGQRTEVVFQNLPKLYLLLAAKLGSIKVTHLVLVWKAWRCCEGELRFGTMWKSWGPWVEPQRGYWLKRSSFAADNPSNLEILLSWDECRGQQQVWVRVGLIQYDILCVQSMSAEAEKWPKPFGGAKIINESWALDTQYLQLELVLVLLCSDCDCTWFYLLEVFFLNIVGAHILETLDFKRDWIFLRDWIY